jgi:alkaline phosphatase D
MPSARHKLTRFAAAEICLMDRRQFLISTIASSALVLARSTHAAVRPKFAKNPFTLGVASGYPRPDGMSIWTRMAPSPLEPRGGISEDVIAVDWQVSADVHFGKILAKGTAYATPEWAHSVHVDVVNLPADRWYYYRFICGDAISPVGRSRSAPTLDAAPNKLRIALASCAHYEQGYFANYRAMAADNPDLMIHVGDYIYESSWGSNLVRSFNAPEPMTLDDYRARHALYRTDPDLQLAHASCPWLLTWDDHEVDNDYAGNVSQDDDTKDAFAARRMAAYQAYFEHMPMPHSMIPMGRTMRIHQRVQYGNLADFFILDERQYRSPLPCPELGRRGSRQISNDCAARTETRATLLGHRQEAWFAANLAKSSTRWNLIAQQLLFVTKNSAQGAAAGTGLSPAYNSDGWDGYSAAQARMIAELSKKTNPVLLGGDVHVHYAADVHADQKNIKSKIIASEFTGSSITSQSYPDKTVQAELPDNPHIRYANGNYRGYVRMDITPEALQVQLTKAEDVRDANTKVSTLASFKVQAGRPGVEQIS